MIDPIKIDDAVTDARAYMRDNEQTINYELNRVLNNLLQSIEVLKKQRKAFGEMYLEEAEKNERA
jgi:hypothetical protein